MVTQQDSLENSHGDLEAYHERAISDESCSQALITEMISVITDISVITEMISMITEMITDMITDITDMITDMITEMITNMIAERDTDSEVFWSLGDLHLSL